MSIAAFTWHAFGCIALVWVVLAVALGAVLHLIHRNNPNP